MIQKNDLLANAIIEMQKAYIEELEEKIKIFKKALIDTELNNKCRPRKVKVKHIGRTKNVRKNNYR